MVQIFNEPTMPLSPLEQLLGELGQGLTSGFIQGRSSKGLAELMGIPKEKQKAFSRLTPEAQQLYMQRQRSVPEVGKLSGLLESFGMAPEEAQKNAELYSSLTAGGQTQLATALIDNIQRNYAPQEGIAQQQGAQEEAFDFPQSRVFEGLTPKERVARQKEVYNDNVGFYKEHVKSIDSGEKQARSLKQLDTLNKSGKLPEGKQRWNVDLKTGDLRIPALATPEAQLYAKIVNDFTTQAKDSYGARITNFELNRFLMRLPTLANTKEGRELIHKQMSITQDLSNLYNNSLKQVYDHYGLRGIDAQEAEKIAEDMIAEKKEALLREYDNIVSVQNAVIDETPLAPVDKGTALTDPVMKKILQETNNDPGEALKRARELGYDV